LQRRTALINEIRGFLLERGITFAADSKPNIRQFVQMID
jgi:hypothetical protein